MLLNLGIAPVSVANSIVIVGGSIQLENDQQSPGNNMFYGTSALGVRGWFALSSEGVNDLAGTAGQVLVNGTSGSAQTGSITLTLATALVAINSITSVAGQNLVLATGTTGTALSIASATNIATFSAGISGTTATLSSLTAGRVTFATTGGLLTDDADMTFSTDTLTVTKVVGGGISLIANAITNANSVTSASGQNLVLALGTGGTALTLSNSTLAATFAGAVTISSSTQSTSGTTGALIVVGGIGLLGNIICGGDLVSVAVNNTGFFRPGSTDSSRGQYGTDGTQTLLDYYGILNVRKIGGGTSTVLSLAANTGDATFVGNVTISTDTIPLTLGSGVTPSSAFLTIKQIGTVNVAAIQMRHVNGTTVGHIGWGLDGATDAVYIDSDDDDRPLLLNTQTGGQIRTGGNRVTKLSVLTGATTLGVTHDTVICNSGSAFTVTLPASPIAGQLYSIKNKGVGLITVSGNGANLFSTSTSSSVSLYTGDAVIVQYDGTVWAIF